MTLNTFQVASKAVTGRLANEQLQDLKRQAGHLKALLEKHKFGAVAQQLDAVRLTFRLFHQEFASRAADGWPLDFGWPTRTGSYPLGRKHSESPAIWTRPQSSDKPDWAPPAVLELEFRGWFQCRLATDPDGAFARRGATGNAFAIGDEPDLDRVIRFQPEGAVVRPHCPPVGVTVVAARLLKSALHAPASGTPVPRLVGGKVNLLGEPIDPFVLEVSSAAGDRLRRGVVGGPVNDMTPTQRRGTSRFPVFGAQAQLDAMRTNLANMQGVVSPQDFVKERIEKLTLELAKIPPERQLGHDAVALRFRLKVLREIGWGILNVRWTRFFFDCEYFHTLSGAAECKIAGGDPAFRVRSPQGEPTADANSKWLVHYHMGFFDTDALAAYVHGLLRIPVEWGG